MKRAAVVVATVACTIVAVIIGIIAFAYSGMYDIGADDHHAKPVAAILDTLRERSIEARAGDVRVPNLDDPSLLAEGAEHYAEMCTGCHLAPGMGDSEIRKGLYPHPPNLAEHGVQDPREAFWVIKHGIKMSAMPAWGATHSDEKIWAIVAFVRKLPGMTPAQYRTATSTAGGDEERGHEHEGMEHQGMTDSDHAHGGHPPTARAASTSASH